MQVHIIVSKVWTVRVSYWQPTW